MLDKIKEDLKKAITEFTIEDFNIYTMNELYMQIANKTNEVIEIVKLLQDYLDEQIFIDVENIELKQNILEETFKQLIINAGNSNAEIVESRIDYDGNVYSTLKERLNKNEINVLKEIKKDNMLSKNKQIIAHRGCWLFSPENTLDAIYDAKKYGYDYVELDISKTKDEKYILMHDTTVDRTTNGTGEVSTLTLSEIQQLVIDTGSYNNEHIYKVPTFEEAVKLCSELGLGINLDCSKIWFNERTINEVVFILEKYNMFSKTFFVISDNARELITSLYPNVFVTWLNNKSDFSQALLDVEKYKNGFISYKITDITQDMIYELNRYNIKFFIYGVNNDYDYELALSFNPTFIEVDNIIPKKGVI